MRRYLTEQKREKGVQFVQKTDDYPSNPPHISVPEIKEELITRRGVRVRDVSDVMKDREKLLNLDQADPNF